MVALKKILQFYNLSEVDCMKIFAKIYLIIVYILLVSFERISIQI